MIYVDIDDLYLAQEWKQDAQDALDAVKAANAAERTKVINDHQTVWKSLKNALRKLSKNKCWYCESMDERSDNAVDHYRPKGNVKDADPPHAGYWWLAFESTNYRFSCTYCNSIRKGAEGVSGGKQDYFPLLVEGKRARLEENDLDEEFPVLLDPTNPADTHLLAFSDDGNAGPDTSDEQSIDYMRAKTSIRRYHLNHPDIAERRTETMKRVRKWVKDADRHLKRHQKDPADTYVSTNYNSRLRDVIRATRRKSEFCAAARYTVAGMQSSSEAAQVITKTGFG